MQKLKTEKPLKAETYVSHGKGSLKVTLPNGFILIHVGLKDAKKRPFDQITAWPNKYPGAKKIIVKRQKDTLQLVECKTAKF